MATRKRYSESEQYEIIMKCRTSGLSDYQWCEQNGIYPGNFYNWVSKLRKKACYDIPDSVNNNRSKAKPLPAQDVVPLTILPDIKEDSEGGYIQSTDKTFAPTMELSFGGISVRISNDADPLLISQMIGSLKGGRC